MDLRKTTEDLVKFRTETGTPPRLTNALAYIAASFDGTGAVVKMSGLTMQARSFTSATTTYDARCAGARTY